MSDYTHAILFGWSEDVLHGPILVVFGISLKQQIHVNVILIIYSSHLD